jgi:hypothetical protein
MPEHNVSAIILLSQSPNETPSVMPDQPNVVTFTAAAEEKDCGRTTLYRARDRGEINTVKIGNTTMIRRDDAFADWKPRGAGGWPRPDDE